MPGGSPSMFLNGKWMARSSPGSVVVVAEVVELHLVGVLEVVDLRTQRLAVHALRPAVGLEVADQIAVTRLGHDLRHMRSPAALGIPEAGRTHAQILFVGLVGEADRPQAVALREIRQHGVRVGRTHKLALAGGHGGLQLVQHIGGDLGHLLDGESGCFEDIFHARKFFAHDVEKEFVALPDDKLVFVGGEVGVVEVGVPDGDVFHTGDGIKGRGPFVKTCWTQLSCADADLCSPAVSRLPAMAGCDGIPQSVAITPTHIPVS